jgi:hypothetical protein
MKIVENPTMNAIVFGIVFAIVFDMPRECLSSSKDTPVINDTYAGTRGKTHGERNDITPPKNASVKDTSFILYVPLLL